MDISPTLLPAGQSQVWPTSGEDEKKGEAMYQRILVPLDGSKLAESVLPHVGSIATGCGVPDVVLATVTERIATTAGPT